MSRYVGDVLLVLRRAADITQEELASRLGITQAALSRYENDLREPDDEMLDRLSEALGVTSDFLRHEFRMHGAIAADAHMRRQKTTKPSDWEACRSPPEHRADALLLSAGTCSAAAPEPCHPGRPR